MEIRKTEHGATAFLQPGEIPGTIVIDGALHFPVGGRYYKIEALDVSKEHGLVPILDIPMMEDVPMAGEESE